MPDSIERSVYLDKHDFPTSILFSSLLICSCAPAFVQNMDGEQETLAQARAGIAGVTAFVVFVLWVTSFWTARRRHDRSRVGVWWLKLALPLYVM